MSAAPQWFQFTIARMLHATFWFAVCALLVGSAGRLPIIVPSGPQPENLRWIILEFVGATLALGAAVGALFGRPIRGALNVITLLLVLLCFTYTPLLALASIFLLAVGGNVMVARLERRQKRGSAACSAQAADTDRVD